VKSELRRIAGQLETMVYASPHYNDYERGIIRSALQLVKDKEDARIEELTYEPRMFSIWCEGFRATGQSGTATLLARHAGISLKDACLNHAKEDSEFNHYFDADRMTYWGCQIFDNEADARRSFG
jgi:hypothetical protein